MLLIVVLKVINLYFCSRLLISSRVYIQIPNIYFLFPLCLDLKPEYILLKLFILYLFSENYDSFLPNTKKNSSDLSFVQLITQYNGV